MMMTDDQNIINNQEAIIPQKSNMRKGIIVIIIFFVVVMAIFYMLHDPLEENCMLSEVLSTDQNTGNSLRFVECERGIRAYEFNSRSYTVEFASGYVVTDATGKNISLLNKRSYSGTGDRLSIHPIIIYPGSQYFIQSDYYSLMKFEDGKVEKIRELKHTGVGAFSEEHAPSKEVGYELRLEPASKYGLKYNRNFKMSFYYFLLLLKPNQKSGLGKY